MCINQDADEATRRMTRDEYVHYSECRQASFTFRKSESRKHAFQCRSAVILSLSAVTSGKKFREFINAGAYLEVKPNDDIIDVLGFLAFEVVRELCIGAVALKQSFEDEKAHSKRLAEGSKNRKDIIENGSTRINGNTDRSGNIKEEGSKESDAMTEAAKGTSASDSAEEKVNGNMKRKDTLQSSNCSGNNKRNRRDHSPLESSCGLFAMPPAKASPLRTSHIREAFARLQRDRSALSIGTGGVPGGLKRTRVFVI